MQRTKALALVGVCTCDLSLLKGLSHETGLDWAMQGIDGWALASTYVAWNLRIFYLSSLAALRYSGRWSMQNLLPCSKVL